MDDNISQNNKTSEPVSAYYTNLRIQHDITVKISSMSNLEEALSYVIESVCQIQEIDCGGIYLIDHHTGSIHLATHHNLSGEFVEHSNYYKPGSRHAELINQGARIHHKYADLERLGNPLYSNEGLRSALIIPIFYNQKAIAAFNLASRHADEFTPETIMAVESIASGIGGAIARIQTEKALHESQQNFRIFFDTIEEFLFILDENGIIIKSNKYAQSKLGYTGEELIGRSVLDVHPEDRRNEAGEIVQKMLAGEADFCPVPLVTRGGKLIPVETKVTTGEWNGKKALFGISRDITWRQKAENELRESEEKYRTITDSTTDIIFIIDKTGKQLFFNNSVESILGYKKENILGKSFTDFVPAKELPRYFSQLKNTFVQKELRHFITQVIHNDGHLVDVEINGRVISMNGELVGLGTMRDITDRLRTEKVIKESEEKYRTLVETMQDGVYRSTPEGKFIHINPALVRILGYSSKKELLDIDIKKDLYFDITDRESAVLTEQQHEQAIYPLKRKDGTKIWVEDHGWLIKDDHGKVLFHEGVLRDITERKEAELKLEKYSQELAEINETKDKFFNIIAHDLKSPFNTILGFAELLIDDFEHLNNADVKRYLLNIQKSSQHACNLIDNLLLWARAQNDTLDFFPDSCNVADIINQNLELFENVAKAKNIALFAKNTEPCPLFADRNMIDTVVRNLIANAIKFTSANGKILIEVSQANNQVEVSVSDTGVGIPAQHIPDLFKLETKYTTTGTANEKGTGLGLILCKEFIERHGGNIWVESEVGKGSVFTFTIPVEK